MNRFIFYPIVLTSLLLTALLAASPTAQAAADTSDTTQTVNGVRIFLGFMPAQAAGSATAKAGDAAMHATDAHGEHIIVALFDATTGERISNAQVEAAVGELGCGDTWKPLVAMNINDTVTYGNYFDMSGEGKIYQIHLLIKWPGHGDVREAVFTHRVYDEQ